MAREDKFIQFVPPSPELFINTSHLKMWAQGDKERRREQV
jgi:hypothetical protein